jgi:antitoxin component of MazEF toxin-antitoxin module
MIRKIFKTGNSSVVSLPTEFLDALDLVVGSEVAIELDREAGRLTLAPAPLDTSLAGFDEEFARQVANFIETYRPALEALADGP